jgi:hypothetical protein
MVRTSNILRELVTDQREYVDMAHIAKSYSVVRYSMTKAVAQEKDQIILDIQSQQNGRRAYRKGFKED